MVSKGNHPQMAARFRLVKYFTLYTDLWKPRKPPIYGGRNGGMMGYHFFVIMGWGYEWDICLPDLKDLKESNQDGKK